MPQNNSTYSFQGEFDVVNQEFIFTDNTDYAGLGINVADVNGVFTMIDPANNTHVINIDANVSLTDTITLNLTSDNLIIPGTYQMTYVISETGEPDQTVSYSFDFGYETPTADVNMTVDCILPELTAQDNTNYIVEGVTPTLSNRTLTLKYPPTTGEADVVGVSNVSTSVLYTVKGIGLQHSSVLDVDLSYDYGNDITITDTLVANEYIDVLCDNDLCDVYCIIKKQYNRYQDAKCKSKKVADEELEKFIKVVAYSQLIWQAMRCGKGDDIAAYVAEIKKVTNSTGDCGCDSDEPVLVTGLGGGAGSAGDVIVQSGAAPIVVTSQVIGQDTVYSVSIDPTIVTKINNLNEVSVIGINDATVTSQVLGGGEVQYTVDVQIPAAPVEDQVYAQLRIYKNGADINFQTTILKEEGDLVSELLLPSAAISGAALNNTMIFNILLSSTPVSDVLFLMNAKFQIPFPNQLATKNYSLQYGKAATLQIFATILKDGVPITGNLFKTEFTEVILDIHIYKA